MRVVHRLGWLVIPLIVAMTVLWIVRGDTGSPAEVTTGSTPPGSEATGRETTPSASDPSNAVSLPSVAPSVGASTVTSTATPPPDPVEPDFVGLTPAIPGDANANVRSVVEAARSGTNPERLTPLLAPAPYDHQRFLADPQAYLDIVEPGRVYQSAEPGEQVPQLDVVGDAVATIPQGGQTILRVRTVPLAPTTFTSFECGAFANHLTSITVQADAEGVASAVFTAPPGTLNDVTILAGSPLASGQVNFCVTVTPAVAQQASAVQ
jgi:hypothetical protein